MRIKAYQNRSPLQIGFWVNISSCYIDKDMNIHLIGGPTASGKTALALDIARRENGVIINADAMQVYADLPLLTAQPTAAEKAEIPHELFEVFAPSEKSSAGRWLSLAEAAIVRAVQAGKTPIVVGGTGLYFSALLGGLADIPPIPSAIHEDAVALYDKEGHDSFREKLSALDPESAAKIKPNDRQRLIRAYEVAAHTGKTLGEWQKESIRHSAFSIQGHSIKRHLLLPEREKLYAMCDARFLRMIEQGALEEVRALLAQRLDPDLPSMKILGVRELAAHLRGEITLQEAIQKAQQFTRNYAKRQVTWFKNQWKDAEIT